MMPKNDNSWMNVNRNWMNFYYHHNRTERCDDISPQPKNTLSNLHRLRITTHNVSSVCKNWMYTMASLSLIWFNLIQFKNFNSLFYFAFFFIYILRKSDTAILSCLPAYYYLFCSFYFIFRMLTRPTWAAKCSIIAG